MAKENPFVRPSEDERRQAGAKLKAAREAAGLTQIQAAEMVGVPQSRMSEWERGDRMPSWTTLVKIAVTLGLDPAIIAPELRPSDQRIDPVNAINYDRPGPDWEAFERFAVSYLQSLGYEIRKK